MSIRKREWTTPSGEPRSAWAFDYRDAQGTRRQKSFPTRKQAVEFETRARAELRDGTHTADNKSITLKEAGERWLARGEREGLEQSTLDAYRQHLHLHILGKDGAPSPIAGQRLNQLTRPMIENFRDWMLDNGRSKAMAKRVIGSLTALIKEAERTGYVAQNVARGVVVKRSGREKAQIVPPTKDQIRKLIAAASGEGARPIDLPMMMVLIFAGLRASELRGLTWTNVDLKAGTLTIVQRADRKNEIGAPKSRSGFRTIPLPASAISALREWKLQCRPSKLDLVFPSERGTPIFHANIVIGFQEPVQKRAGLTEPWILRSGKPKLDEDGEPALKGIFTLHDFRHACASLWIEQKVVPKRVQSWMGHHSIQVTFDTYGHLFEALEQDASVMAAIDADLMGTA